MRRQDSGSQAAAVLERPECWPSSDKGPWLEPARDVVALAWKARGRVGRDATGAAGQAGAAVRRIRDARAGSHSQPRDRASLADDPDSARPGSAERPWSIKEAGPDLLPGTNLGFLFVAAFGELLLVIWVVGWGTRLSEPTTR